MADGDKRCRASTLPPVRSSLSLEDCCNGQVKSHASLPFVRQRRSSGGTRSDAQQPRCKGNREIVRGSLRSSSGGVRGEERQGSYLPSSEGKLPGAVLFLDVDGVLHPAHCRFPRQQFKASCLQHLREVLEATGAEIVLSTAWRLDADARQQLAEKLTEHGLVSFVGRTGNIEMFHRSREILAWVRKYKPTSWVAVDDWPLLEESDLMAGHFVQTRPRYGLQPATADAIVELFNKQDIVVAPGPL